MIPDRPNLSYKEENEYKQIKACKITQEFRPDEMAESKTHLLM